MCYYKVEQNVFLLAKTQCISSVFNGCILSDWTSLVSMMALVPLISTQHPNSFTVGNPTVLLANFTAEKKIGPSLKCNSSNGDERFFFWQICIFPLCAWHCNNDDIETRFRYTATSSH